MVDITNILENSRIPNPDPASDIEMQTSVRNSSVSQSGLQGPGERFE